MLVYFLPYQLANFLYIHGPGLGPRLIPKQIPGKRDGMTTTGLNEYFRVGWVLGQEVTGTILSMELQVGAHSSTMNAIGSSTRLESNGRKDLDFTIQTCLTLLSKLSFPTP